MFSDVTFAWERVFVFAQKRKYATTVKPTSPAPPLVPSFLSLSLSHLLSLTHPHACAHCTRKLPLSLSLSHTYSIRHFGKKKEEGKKDLLASCSYYLVSLPRRVNAHTHPLPPSKLVHALSLSLSLHILSLSFAHPFSSCTLSHPLSNSFSATW